MKISLNWLKEYIDINDFTTEELEEMLTQTGLEVEGIEKFETIEGGLEGVVVGEVLTCEKHPDADKLKITTVDIGEEEPSTIVCGAPNVAAGQKVLVATVGTTLYPEGGEPFKIKKAKIRGQESFGMICAEDELGIGHSHDGIMILETELPNGTPASEYLNIKSDQVIEIGLTPNRSDATSHIGVARDIHAVTGNAVKWPETSEFPISSEEAPINVVVENKEACPRYAGITIKNVKVGSSPDWLQNSLLAIGLTPKNNVVDVTNFVLHEMGQPLHAFDASVIAGNEVRVKTLPSNTAFTTLDDVERKLHENDLMICNGNDEGMCIAGVFGGKKSGVSESTDTVFLESAYFNPNYIRSTSQRHLLKTDASFRFERGTDPNICVYALKRAALLISELTGGKITGKTIDIYETPIIPVQIDVKYKNIDRLIGIKIDRNRIKEILNRLEIKVSDETETGFTATVPTYRVDVTREADVIEEIVRIYGLNNIPLNETLSADFLSSFDEKDPGKIYTTTAHYLASLGFHEIMSNSLTKPQYAESVEDLKSEEDVVILNKLSEDLGVMRQTLLFGGLEAIARNQNRKQQNLKLFELGKTYKKTEKGYSEGYKLALFVTGDSKEENWQGKAVQSDFHWLFGKVMTILEKFNFNTITKERISDGILADGLSISVNNKLLVKFGIVKNELTSINEVKIPVWYAEFDWDMMLKLKDNSLKYDEISRFPEVRRDLSLVIDKNISFDDLAATAYKAERKHLKNINVFDVYEGDKIEEGKKAYALSFILENKDKTLTDKMIDQSMNRLIKAFEEENGAYIRK
ncbi:phenylalanine--tRNA ligase subunit beta [Marinigracilibium pacificum]|uniref:Phenylalanine--tRNA ligase beta subunit n=1 Tax=Marinigracilibium pacificum TaxID=2729599 RepID=A0A848J945_9BACT|nr:phenylalanine--tRNA ligase subunit beta [Marinigracilibium pacificum]NMM49572.1 phenylalanine--tRNA ligase subunit beta [Marinigracilibium pacificum]